MFRHFTYCATRPLIALISVLLWSASPGHAQACRLALVLGFDVSRSVDEQDYRLQTNGIVAALNDRQIRRLLLRSPPHVALAVFEWAGQYEQTLISDWTILDSATAIDGLVGRIQSHQRGHNGLTAVGSALTFARDLMQRGPNCLWQTIDLAGDGALNNGPAPRRIYDTTNFGGIVVNGLAIGAHEDQIEHWFRRNVLHGPGAFVEFASTHEDFADAFRRKLIRELTEPLLGALQLPEAG